MSLDFGSLPSCSNSTTRFSANFNSQSLADICSAAAAILILKNVLAGTARRLNAWTGPFFLGVMSLYSTTIQAGQCGCCEKVLFDTLYQSVQSPHAPQGGSHG